MKEIFNYLKEKFFYTRYNVIIFVFMLFSAILLSRLFVLQILKGHLYLNNYTLLVEKNETIEATRGNIYDRNGKLLAYNDVANSIVLEDKFSNMTSEDKNKKLNEELYQIISNIEKNGDSIKNDFQIQINKDNSFSFTIDGKKQQRFRADIFGKKQANELGFDKKLKFNTANVSANKIMEYLMSNKKYDISTKYSMPMRYKICILRYAIGLNSYRKYIATTISDNISEKSLAYIKENQPSLPGVEVKEKQIRKYVDSKYISSIVGYTGKISNEEYRKLSKKSNDISPDDVVGKSGMEQYMNKYLTGTKGKDTFYVDTIGNVIKKTDHKNPKVGNDVYLSIDMDLQKRTYNLLEAELVDILSNHLVNSKKVGFNGKDEIMVSVYDAYVNLIQNKLIDTDHFTSPNATDLEKRVYQKYENYSNDIFSNIKSSLDKKSGEKFKNESEENQVYYSNIIRMLKNNGVLIAERIDKKDDTYKAWTNGTISINEYLRHCIEKDWINISFIKNQAKYADSEELYKNLVNYILSEIKESTSFKNSIYEYAIREGAISGNEVCALLYDQNILNKNDDERNALLSGKISSYGFILDKIRSRKLTPGQLGLTPCAASCVILNSKTGEVLACVSYPGYDGNKLANEVDKRYYEYLTSSKSGPLYNHATQQRTAPGSTFKMLTSTAGLAEHVITPQTTFFCTGEFDLVSNKPKCWIYPGRHGSENVTKAIKDSCNFFFYSVGYHLAETKNGYNDGVGIKKIKKYASLYGLDRKTGVEIEENPSQIATQYPVMAAIGQSNNNLTTIGLARYVNAVATRGNMYNLTLLNKVQNKKGKIVKNYAPKLIYKISVLNSSEWDAIHTGMRQMVQTASVFNGFIVNVSGKTGTAQESTKKPTHGLFVGFAPSESPEIAFAIRIPNGYDSDKATNVSKDILGCYFGDQSSIDKANSENSMLSSNNVMGD